MKLTVVAATGGIGRQVLAQALTAGHDVTALVRNPAGLPAGVPVVRADLSDPDPGAVESAVRGADAVLSGLGPRRNDPSGVAARGTRALVHAMESTGKEHSAARAGTLLAAIDGVLLRAVREESRQRAQFLRDSLELLMTALVGKSTQPEA